MGTVKISPDGALLWALDFDGRSPDHETASALAVSDAGSVYVAGVEVGPIHSLVTIKYSDPSGWSFIRGDADGDGRTVGVADALRILNVNFLGAGPPPCWAALDANGDGDTNGVTDAISL